MNKNLLCLLLLLVLGACKIDGKEEIEQNNLNFSTTDDSELFFKNVRQLYYDLEEIPAANLNVFRIKERTMEAEYPVVNLAIVWNWLQDEAYILLEPNEILADEDPIVVYWDNPSTNETGQFTYEKGNNTRQLLFATDLYNGITNGCDFKIQVNGESLSLLEKRGDREAFRKTMSDYFRLTRTFD